MAMSAQAPESTETKPVGGRWRHWLRFAALATLLLLLSEALWLWQTWPVRELLQPSTPERAASAP
jgi:hypothetical protein